ncbi:MAG: hypothetical protein KF878_12325 [Planctomycetes bacterium]|nr:hypothetical protein [Planctomycetota bacterium]
MKKMSVALLVVLTAGCALFNPPATEDQGGGGGEQQQAQGGGMDPTQFVQAPGRVPVASDAKLGWMAERTTQASGQTLVESYALVGEDGDAWLVESKSPTIDAMAASFPDLKGALLGLTVRKADGVVTKAVLGKPGEAGKEVKIAPAGDAAGAPAEGTADRVSIGLGTFDATKHTHGEVTTWVGSAGATQGVLLKSQGSGQDYELAEMPSKATKDVNGVSVNVTGLSYTNGLKLWMTDHQIIAAILGGGADASGKRVGMYRMESGGTVTEVTGLATDAKPQLKW